MRCSSYAQQVERGKLHSCVGGEPRGRIHLLQLAQRGGDEQGTYSAVSVLLRLQVVVHYCRQLIRHALRISARVFLGGDIWSALMAGWCESSLEHRRSSSIDIAADEHASVGIWLRNAQAALLKDRIHVRNRFVGLTDSVAQPIPQRRLGKLAGLLQGLLAQFLWPRRRALSEVFQFALNERDGLFARGIFLEHLTAPLFGCRALPPITLASSLFSLALFVASFLAHWQRFRRCRFRRGDLSKRRKK